MDIHTIGDLIEHRHKLAVHCNAPGCHNYKKLDLQALGERLGFDQPYLKPYLAPKLKCSKCGSKDISLSLSGPSP